MTPKEGARELEYTVKEYTYQIFQKALQATRQGERILLNHTDNVLSKPFRRRPSRPGQPPRYRTQRLRKNWVPNSSSSFDGSHMRIVISIKSNTPYFTFLEEGTSRMARRPMRRRIRMRARKEIAALFNAI